MRITPSNVVAVDVTIVATYAPAVVVVVVVARGAPKHPLSDALDSLFLLRHHRLCYHLHLLLRLVDSLFHRY